MRFDRTLVAALLVASSGALVVAQQDTTGEVALGANSVGSEDSLNRAGEYNVDKSSPALFGWADIAFGAHSGMQVDLRFLHEDDQLHRFLIDASPSWTIEASVNRFRQNLPHDPLTNLETYDTGAKVLRHTDEDAGLTNNYRIRYEDNRIGVAYRPVSDRSWEFALEGRQLKRKGGVQHLANAHCSNCHITGQTRPVDQQADDLTARIAYVKPSWGISYQFTARDFEERADATTLLFDEALHPTFLTPIFKNRASFDSTSGPLPVGLVTAHERKTHLVRAYWNGESDHVDGVVAYSKTEADGNVRSSDPFGSPLNPGLDLEYTTALLRYVHDLSAKAHLGLSGRYEKTTSDDVFVDMAEPISTAGPTAGFTYREVYGAPDALGYGDRGFVADWTRRSPADREVFTTRADMSYRLGERGSQRLKVSLKAKSTSRDEVRVTDGGETTTQEYSLRAVYRGRTRSQTVYQVDGEWYRADDPFNNVDGGCRRPGTDERAAAGSEPFPPYGPWTMYQYFEFHELRFANLTNQPSNVYRLGGNVTFNLAPNSALTLHAKGSWATSDETQVSDWSRDAYDAGGSFWWAPSGRLYTTTSLWYMKEDQETHICVPLFDG